MLCRYRCHPAHFGPYFYWIKSEKVKEIYHICSFHIRTCLVINCPILRLCAERDISINKLATISALPPSSVKNILYGRSTDPKILTIKKICDGLDITLGEFFSTPEFDALEQEIK